MSLSKLYFAVVPVQEFNGLFLFRDTHSYFDLPFFIDIL